MHECLSYISLSKAKFIYYTIYEFSGDNILFKPRIGHIREKRLPRIGHMYPIKEVVQRGGESKIRDKKSMYRKNS